MGDNGRTALVTGANSGIGFETAAQLAERGYSSVILVTRTLAKGEEARARLFERCGEDRFDLLAADLAEPHATAVAAAELAKRPGTIDLLILNAGMSTGPPPQFNSDGVELTFASTLIGHHVLTIALLQEQKLAPAAHIVIAGSENARGDTINSDLPDFTAFSQAHFDGNLELALEAMARAQPPYEFHPMNAYGIAKAYVAWWAAVLAEKLPPGMVVNAVSPGFIPVTNFSRNQPFLTRNLLLPLVRLLGGPLGISGPLTMGARRYIEASEFPAGTNGRFFASAPGKLVGPLELQNNPHFLNKEYQQAAWNVIVRLAGGFDYPPPTASQEREM